MSATQTQIVVQEELKALRASIERESNVRTNIFNTEQLLTYVDEMMRAEKSLPEGAPYSNYEEWLEDISKDNKGYNSSLATIEKNKDLLVALENYLERNPVAEE